VTSYTKGHRPDSFIRVHLARVNAIGPGKADLLEAIGETGSMAAAARRMGISYRRAWSMVKAMNDSFRVPLVESAKGGAARGGARLTAAGREALARYRKMEVSATAAVAQDAAAFRKLLRER
jgi:molybdate transport system regulatory protein